MAGSPATAVYLVARSVKERLVTAVRQAGKRRGPVQRTHSIRARRRPGGRGARGPKFCEKPSSGWSLSRKASTTTSPWNRPWPTSATARGPAPRPIARADRSSPPTLRGSPQPCFPTPSLSLRGAPVLPESESSSDRPLHCRVPGSLAGGRLGVFSYDGEEGGSSARSISRASGRQTFSLWPSIRSARSKQRSVVRCLKSAATADSRSRCTSV